MRSKLLIIIFIISFFYTSNALAYSVETHAFLTDEIIKFYNQNFLNNKISDELKPYLIDGSRREDDAPRWMNHFYDPVYNRGLSRDPAIDPFYFLGTWQRSKDWAHDSRNQNSSTYKAPATIASILTAIQQRAISVLTTETDFTWQRAIKFYVQGEKEKAMFTLGHILHLIEDKAVSDHTRNDPHVQGSPYEEYAKKFNPYNPDKNLNQRLQNKSPVILSILNSYFEELAKYSNNNFYSKDTIGTQSGYNLPERDYISKEGDYFYGFKIDKEDGDYKLFIKEKMGLFGIVISNKTNISLLLNKEGGDKVMSDYWSRLSTKSVQYGAGVINLFFQEAEKAKNNPDLTKENKSFFGQVIDNIKNLMVLVGNFFSGIIGANEQIQPAGQVGLNQSAEIQSPESNQSGEVESQQTENKGLIISNIQSQINLIQNQLNQISQQVQTLQAQTLLASLNNTLTRTGGGRSSDSGGAGGNSGSGNSSAPNQSPIAYFIYSSSNYYVNEIITFDAASSTDPDGQIVSYQWDFGDNINTLTAVATTNHSYSLVGNYLVQLTVFDNQNASSTAFLVISILSDPRPSPVQNFVIQYSSSTMELIFNWEASQNFSHSTSTIIYKIIETGNIGSTLPIIETTSTTAQISINEIGRDYQFSIRAFDENGLSSATTTASISIPSFLLNLYFYQDPRDNNRNLVEAYYNQYPFIPDLFSQNKWQLVVFYLNSEAEKQFSIENSPWQPNDLTNILAIEYKQCSGGSFTQKNSLVLPINSNYCGTSGGAYSAALSFPELEDNHFIIQAASPSQELNLTNQDYLSVAFYTTYSTQTMDGRIPHFQLVAVDKTKYYFSKPPLRQPPQLDGEITLNFDRHGSQLNISWPRAIDPDTIDSLLTYEIQYNSPWDDWGLIGNTTSISRLVAPGDSFSISIRAKDDFDNYSSSTLTALWSYPETIFYINQTEINGWSDEFGKKDWAGNAGISLQSITPETDFQFNKIVLRIKRVLDTGFGANFKLSVFNNRIENNQDRPDFANLIAASNLPNIWGNPENQDLTFSFNNSISASSGSKYWLALEVESYSHNSYYAWTTNAWANTSSMNNPYTLGEAGKTTVRNSIYSDSIFINSIADWYMKIGLEP